MTGRVKVGVAITVGVVAFLWVGGALWENRPFQTELGSYRTSLADRTESQRHNIRQAVRALDGVVVEPGTVFSFNETVGPRTPERGYCEAPAYMEYDFVTSVGGGICQVSSTVYNAAALSGLRILERHPHSRRVASVPPGRDATVWYGLADLKFKNTYLNPVRLSVLFANETITIAVKGNTDTLLDTRVYSSSLTSIRPGVIYNKTMRITKVDGTLVLQEILSIDAYSN